MISRLIQLALTQRLFVLIVFLIGLVAGFTAWQRLPIDAFPDISPTQVNIIIQASGMTAEEIEAQITQPIETELLGIPNQSILRSTTKYAIASITLDFEDGTDIYWARQQVAERLNSLWATLPSVATGGVAPMSTPLSEMFMFTVDNPQLSLSERKHIIDWQIRPALRTVAGVADVNVLGGFTRTIQFTPNLAAMARIEVTLGQIAEALQARNINGSVGRIDVGNDSLIVRTQGRVNGIEELAEVVVAFDQGIPITLTQLGDLSYGSLTRYGGVTHNGEEATQGLVVALKNTNTAEVIEGVLAKLEDIKPGLPSGTEVNVFYNRKTLIDTAVGTITSALGQAVVIVIVLLALFLGRLGASFVVACVIPVAVLLTFLLMEWVGLTANLMSLGGIVIAIGMLVDASVVVVENIVTRLSTPSTLPRLHIIFRATKMVAAPVIAGTLIVLVVFSPLLTLTGLEGKLFSPVALTIVFAMSAALVTAFTLIPVLASLIIRQSNTRSPVLLQKLQAAYQHSLAIVLKAPKSLITVCAVSLVLTMLVFTQLGKTFMPTLDEGDIIVQLEKSPTIALAASLELDKQIEKAILENVPEVLQVVARTGSDELGLDPMSLNETDVFMQLAPRDTWRFDSKEALSDAIREVLAGFPGINIGFTQPIQMRVSEMLTGSTGTVSVQVFGDDIATLSSLAHDIADIVRNTEGAVDVQMTLIEGGDYLRIVPKAHLVEALNLSVGELSRYLKSQVTGIEVSNIINGRVITPIMFSNQQAGVSTINAVQGLRAAPVMLPNGEVVNLGAVADIDRVEGPSIIERENAARFAVVAMNVEGTDLVSFVDSLQSNVAAQLTLPANYSLSFGGEFENQIRASNNLMMVIPVVIALIVIILFALFGDLKIAALIMANVPFALMGGVLALWITNQYVSVPASIGFIALLGVAVLNGVVMVDHFKQLSALKGTLVSRIASGAGDRLRPILMTATTAIFGLLPLAFASGPGAEIQKPLAIVVIGGLITSTLITLYLLPVFYYLVERRHHV
ncbi:efflux RND transporter permease subunit [Alteromonas facilis]|uniref:efflux RND transporter permease subunit n=1 Tax=Alteromonas facilis TaxID=2048004 RepID=UPI000C284B03|nr:efflux RND transporter permease subunit [Alteromonas facilis]